MTPGLCFGYLNKIHPPLTSCTRTFSYSLMASILKIFLVVSFMALVNGKEIVLEEYKTTATTKEATTQIVTMTGTISNPHTTMTVETIKTIIGTSTPPKQPTPLKLQELELEDGHTKLQGSNFNPDVLSTMFPEGRLKWGFWSITFIISFVLGFLFWE